MTSCLRTSTRLLELGQRRCGPRNFDPLYDRRPAGRGPAPLPLRCRQGPAPRPLAQYRQPPPGWRPALAPQWPRTFPLFLTRASTSFLRPELIEELVVPARDQSPQMGGCTSRGLDFKQSKKRDLKVLTSLQSYRRFLYGRMSATLPTRSIRKGKLF